MVTQAKLYDLVGSDLKNFTIVEMSEVYIVDIHGQKWQSLGFFRDLTTAHDFLRGETNTVCYKIKKTLVLTDGNVGYVIEDQSPVRLFDDNVVACWEGIENKTPR
jgi:hypothetical protein